MDKYCDIRFILKDSYEEPDYEVQSFVMKAFCNTVDSTFNNIPFDWKDNLNFLQAKIDSLLVTDEELFYLKSNLGLFGNEVFQAGFGFVKNIIKFLERKSKTTEFLSGCEQILMQNWKMYSESVNLEPEGCFPKKRRRIDSNGD